MEETMGHLDAAYLIYLIKEWAAKPENAWFNTKFIDSMEINQYVGTFTIKQKKALLSIYNKCVKEEFTGACGMCLGSPGMMYHGSSDREFFNCPCSDNFNENDIPKKDDIRSHNMETLLQIHDNEQRGINKLPSDWEFGFS